MQHLHSATLDSTTVNGATSNSTTLIVETEQHKEVHHQIVNIK